MESLRIQRFKNIICNILTLVYCSITIFADQSTVIESNKLLFVSYKISVLILCSFIILRSSFFGSTSKSLVSLTFFTFAYYVVVGEFFCPGYNLAYIQGVVVLPLVYKNQFKDLKIPLLTIYIAYLCAFYFGPGFDVEAIGYSSYQLDIILSITTATFLSYFLNRYIVKELVKLEKSNDSYLSLGVNASVLIHDVKNVLTVPLLRLSKIAKEDDEINSSLPKINRAVKSLEEMLKNSVGDVSRLSLKECIEAEVEKLGKNSLYKVRFYSDDSQIKFSKSHFESLVSNIFSNSLKSFDLTKGQLDFSIEAKNGKIIFSDNGEGYPEEVIESFNNYQQAESGTGGTGVGLLNCKRIVEAYGGEMLLSNNNGSAQTTISFQN